MPAQKSQSTTAPAMTRLSGLLQTRPRLFWLLTVLLGVLSAAGFAPLGLWPLALFAIGVFAVLIPLSNSWKQAAWLGWLFGMGHFTLGNNWIATAFTFQSNMPAALGWAAVPLLSVYLAIYPAIAAGAARALAGKRTDITSALAFAGFWVIAEWLRSWVFTGYPWNPFSMVLLGPMDRPGLAALVGLMGAYALSGLAVLLAVGIVRLLVLRRWGRAALSFALLATGMYWPVGRGEEGTLAVTLVQPGIEQDQVNDSRYYEANFTRLTNLSLPVGEVAGPRLVLWPESGMADYLELGYPQAYYNRTTALGSPEFARSRIARAIGEDALLLTGGQRLAFADGRLVGAYNSVLAVGDMGDIRGLYSKSRLVPFGEYLPLRSMLEPIGISRFVPGSIDFLPGRGPQTLDLGAFGKAGIQVCYEIIFGGRVVAPESRPDYIYTGSNDGWFGWFGPPQHFAQARMRAIEEGLPVLRSTTSGISGIIDARGVVRHALDSHRQGRIDAVVPPAAEPTLFARLGNLLSLGWALLFLLFALVALRQRAS